MSTAPQPEISAAEYLAIERNSKVRNEFYRGQMSAMGGASRRQNVIAANLVAFLHGQFVNRPCEVYSSDMRVRVSQTSLDAYPDVVVACDSPQFEDNESDTLLNPIAVFEILSKSTEADDRGKKFEHYRQIPSLREYLLISQEACQLECFSRPTELAPWLFSEANGPDGTLRIESLSCTLKLADLYTTIDSATPIDDEGITS